MTRMFLVILLHWHGVYVPVEIGPMPSWICSAVNKTLPALRITAADEPAEVVRASCELRRSE